MEIDINIKEIENIAKKASVAVLEIYSRDFSIHIKMINPIN